MIKAHTILIFLFIIFTAGCSSDDPIPPAESSLIQVGVFDLSPFLSEPSGIAFNPFTNTLFVVSDTINSIFEIDTTGLLVNNLTINADDLEGICFSKNYDTVYVVEESQNLISTFSLAGSKIKSIYKKLSTNDENGLEGITSDNANSLFIINEKSPSIVVQIKNDIEVSRFEITIIKDLSDICFDNTLKCLWVISDESKEIIQISQTGSILSEWKLPFSKGEGLAIVNDKFYIVNDEDSKLYVFNKPK